MEDGEKVKKKDFFIIQSVNHKINSGFDLYNVHFYIYSTIIYPNVCVCVLHLLHIPFIKTLRTQLIIFELLDLSWIWRCLKKVGP